MYYFNNFFFYTSAYLISVPFFPWATFKRDWINISENYISTIKRQENGCSWTIGFYIWKELWRSYSPVLFIVPFQLMAMMMCDQFRFFLPPLVSDRMRVLDVLCQRVCTESPKCVTWAEDVARGEYLLIALLRAGHWNAYYNLKTQTVT